MKLFLATLTLFCLVLSSGCEQSQAAYDDVQDVSARALPVGSPCGVWRDVTETKAQARHDANRRPNVVFWTLADGSTTCSDAISLSNSPGWAGRSVVGYVEETFHAQIEQ